MLSTVVMGFYDAIAAVLWGWHWVFAHVWSYDSGWSWLAATIALAITVRALLTPISIYEKKVARRLRQLHPQIEGLRQEYGHDRKLLVKEQKKLWKDTGTHPLMSIPLSLVQGIIFLLLFLMFYPPAQAEDASTLLSGSAAASLADASIFGVWLGETFVESSQGVARVPASLLVAIVAASAFVFRRRLLTANMPPGSGGPYDQPEKFLLYALPAAWAVTGISMPLDGLMFFAIWYGWLLTELSIVIRTEDPLRPSEDG